MDNILNITITAEHNVRGLPRRGKSCPVAIAMHEHYPEASKVYTTATYTEVIFADKPSVTWVNPTSLVAFISQYDKGSLQTIPEGSYQFIRYIPDDEEDDFEESDIAQ